MLSTLQNVWSRVGLPSVDGRGPAGVGIAVTAIAVVGSVYLIKETRARWILREKRKHKLISRQLALDGLERHLNESGLSSEKQHEICGLSLVELRDKLQSGELKAVDVIRAYQIQALETNKKTNAITEIVYEAEVEAVKCDTVKNKSDRLLHGVPISIKECFPMKGYDCVIGFSKLIDDPSEDDCVIIKVLKHQGAIPFMRSNVPQTMICYDTCNPVFGQTFNPHGTNRSPGGSSGGEGALLASQASIAGIGSDIGGSVRIPAAFCGICALKPTSERLSKKGTLPLFKGQNMVTSALGPMARDVDGLVVLMKALLCPLHFELDKTVPPIPFRDEIYSEKKKPRIGYYLDDSYMVSTPHMQRAVVEAVEALRAIGYEVVEWKFPDLGWKAGFLWSRAIFSDNGAEIREYLKNDVTDHSFHFVFSLLGLARSKIIHWLMYNIVRIMYPKVSVSVGNLRGVRSIGEWQEYVRDVGTFRKEVEDDLMEKNVDVILAPAYCMPACPVATHQYCGGAGSYTSVFNVLNFPAGSMPVSVATAEDSAKMADYPTSDPWHKTIKNMCVGAEGLPLNVQIASLPWQEERCLRVMKDLEIALKH